MAVYDKELIGKTIKMRSLIEEDAEVTYEMRANTLKNKYLNSPPESVEAQRDYIKRQRAKSDDYYFLIQDLKGNPIGMKAFADYKPEFATVESGRFIGFGTQIQHMEALILSFDFAFDILGVKKIIMTVIEENEAMHSIQKRMGAKETERVFMPDFGCDSIHSELTKDDYLLNREKIMLLIDRFSKRS